MLHIMGQSARLAAVAATLLSASCVDNIDDPAGKVNPSERPDIVSDLLGKVTIGGVDAQELKGEDLPDASTNANAPVVTTQHLAVSVAAGTRVSLAFTVDSESLVRALFAKVAGSPDVYRANLASTKAESAFDFAFDLPSSIGEGTFCVDFAATDDEGLSGRTPQPVCVNVQDETTLTPSPQPTATPSASPTATPSVSPTATPAPTATVTPTAAPTASPTTTPTSAPTQTPSVTPTATPTTQPSPTPSATPTVTPSSSPTPVPTQEPVPGSASACYNETLFVEGTTYSLTYNTSTAGSEAMIDFTDERTVGALTTYDDRPAHPATGMTTSTVSGSGAADGTSISDVTVYDQFDASVPHVNAIGVVSTSETGGGLFATTTTTQTTFVDGILRRFDLEQGDSYVNSYESTTETSTSTAGFPTGDSIVSVSQVETTVTYLGRNVVAVPAGTFDVCQYRDVSMSTTNDETTSTETIVNIAVGTGILVLQESGDSRTQLTGGTLNGATLP